MTAIKNYLDLQDSTKIVEFMQQHMELKTPLTLWFKDDSSQKRVVFQGTITNCNSMFFFINLIGDDIAKLECKQTIYIHQNVGKDQPFFFKTQISQIGSVFTFLMPKLIKLQEARQTKRFSFSNKEKANELIILSEKTNTRYLLNLFDMSQSGASFIAKVDPKNAISPNEIFHVEYISAHTRPSNLKARVARIKLLDKKSRDGSSYMQVALAFNEELKDINHELVEIPLVGEENLGIKIATKNSHLGGMSINELIYMLSTLKVKNKISANKLVKNINSINMKILNLTIKEKYQIIQKLGLCTIAYALRTSYPSVVRTFMDQLRLDVREEIEFLMNKKQPLAIVLKKQEEFLEALCA